MLLVGPETYLFKIDPDTWVRRRFRRLPLFSCLFGTIESRSELYREEIAPVSHSRRTVSEDHVLTWAADRLGIPVLGHMEIGCRYRQAPNGPFAVTHPHKRRQDRA